MSSSSGLLPRLQDGSSTDVPPNAERAQASASPGRCVRRTLGCGELRLYLDPVRLIVVSTCANATELTASPTAPARICARPPFKIPSKLDPVALQGVSPWHGNRSLDA